MATPTLGGTPTTIENCDATTGWTFSSVATDTDQVKEGSASLLGILRNDLAVAEYDITTDSGSSQDMTGRHVRFWINFGALAFLDSEANNGMEFYMGDATNKAYWVIFGNDTYGGGWFNMVLDCDSTPDSGTFTKTAVDIFGIRFNRTGSPANKDNTWIDYLRYGDGYYATGGTSGDEITLAGIYSVDNTNGYGIMGEFEGALFSYGELTIGNGATTTWFDSAGEVLIFTDSPVASTLYGLSAAGSGCRFSMDGSVLRSSGTASNTRFSLDLSDTNLAAVSLINSFVTRASTTTLQSGMAATGNTFTNCGQITHAGADMSDSKVQGYEGTANTSALLYNVNADPDGEMDNMTFIMGSTSTHAIEFGTTSPLTMTLRGVNFSGYTNTVNNNASPLHIKRTSGTVQINLVGCSGITANGYRTDGATVNLVIDPVTTLVNVKNVAGTNLQNARVFLQASDGTGDLDYQDSVTITRSSTTATVAHTGHSFANTTGQYVVIEGANEADYNKCAEITYIDANSYSYTVTESPDTPATGTITATGAIFNDLTDASGNVSDSRTFTNSQPVTGWVRLYGSAGSRYKTANISGTISNTTGLTINVQMVSDE